MDSMLPNPTGHESVPTPPLEHLQAPDVRRDANERQEVVAPGPERLQSANQAVAQAVASTQTVQQQVAHTDPLQVPTAASASRPSVADDVPVIEKEWVALAKDIILRTRQDPREQSAQLEAVKLDYVRKRFGKELKKSEGVS